MISEPTGPDNHSKIDFVVHTILPIKIAPQPASCQGAIAKGTGPPY